MTSNVGAWTSAASAFIFICMACHRRCVCLQYCRFGTLNFEEDIVAVYRGGKEDEFPLDSVDKAKTREVKGSSSYLGLYLLQALQYPPVFANVAIKASQDTMHIQIP